MDRSGTETVAAAAASTASTSAVATVSTALRDLALHGLDLGLDSTLDNPMLKHKIEVFDARNAIPGKTREN